MRHVLFVDDETSLLDGLRRSLRPMRHEWEMSFCTSGEDALATLAERPIDIIVSDMRMPRMDGVELLTRVRAQFPHVVRVVLSGQTEMQSALRSVAVAHAFLHKPCEPEILRSTIDRAATLVDQLNDDRLRAIIANVDCLPSPPHVVSDLNDLLLSPNIEVSDVVSVVERDAAISAKLLSLSNSAFFGIGRDVTDVAGAVTLLGLANVRDLAAQSLLFNALAPGDGVAQATAMEIESHSIEVARQAGEIKLDPVVAREAFAASILHDVGWLVIAVAMPEEQRRIDERVHAGEDRSTVEEEIIGVTHATVGAHLLTLWSIPQPIVEAVAWHHDAPDRAPWHPSAAHAVYVARALADNDNTSFPPGYLDALGMGTLATSGDALTLHAD